jgi:hypothetical protein
MKNSILYILSLSLVFLLYSSTSFAQTHVEIGDATQVSIAAAQPTAGGGVTLDQIIGSFDATETHDIYGITIVDPANLLITTHPFNNNDMFLSLFDENGFNVCWCDDSAGNLFGSGTGLNPTIGAAGLQTCNNGAVGVGECSGLSAGDIAYLYVTICCRFPQDALNVNMQTPGSGPYDHPSTPGGSAGAYTINLQGVADFASTTIANNDANGDGVADIADPCDCTDPMNPDPAVVSGPGGGEVFHELVTVTSDPGETWNMDATTTGALDATGATLTLPAAMTEISPGVYTLDFYHEISVGYTGNFGNGGTTLSISNTCTATCIPPTIAIDDADGDGTPDIADPCDCTDPLNPDPLVVLGPGGGEVFHELVTVTSGIGETWNMDATTTGALDATGIALVLPAAMTEVSPGVYTIDFYHEITVGYAGDFSNGTATLNIANACTVSCLSTVPTLGEWGLIIFTLLMLNTAILFVVRRRKAKVSLA